MNVWLFPYSATLIRRRRTFFMFNLVGLLEILYWCIVVVGWNCWHGAILLFIVYSGSRFLGNSTSWLDYTTGLEYSSICSIMSCRIGLHELLSGIIVVSLGWKGVNKLVWIHKFGSILLERAVALFCVVFTCLDYSFCFGTNWLNVIGIVQMVMTRLIDGLPYAESPSVLLEGFTISMQLWKSQ